MWLVFLPRPVTSEPDKIHVVSKICGEKVKNTWTTLVLSSPAETRDPQPGVSLWGGESFLYSSSDHVFVYSRDSKWKIPHFAYFLLWLFSSLTEAGFGECVPDDGEG